MTTDAFETLMQRLRGGITPAEGAFLRDLAAQVGNGCIVELGSFRGKSAIALAEGARLNPNAGARPVHCIEPHRPFVGYYGGSFGPDDRAAFFQAALDTGHAQTVALINRSSSEAVAGWSEPVGLLFIDGDHRAEGVQRDFAMWCRHVVQGGVIVFDDALDPMCGPYGVAQRLRENRDFQELPAVGKFAAFRKLVPHSAPSRGARSILVACDHLVLTGGMLRMERVGRRLAGSGHDMVYLAFAEGAPRDFETDRAVISFDEAVCQVWDAVFVPGAGFPSSTLDSLARLRLPTFGTRVQLVLNDQSGRDRFLKVNQLFEPNIVVFNTRDWEAGSFTDFSADRFHVLEGAVDTAVFRPLPFRVWPRHDGRFVVGGLANKNAPPLINAIRHLPQSFVLHMFGIAPPGLAEAHADLIAAGRLVLSGALRSDAALQAFYDGIDIICMTEQTAGWSNLVAEAMACGLPVVCTPHGTRALARNGETAVVVEAPDAEVLAREIEGLASDPARAAALGRQARAAVEPFTWDRYACDLLRLIVPDERRHYFSAPSLGLYGKWPPEHRLDGLAPLLGNLEGKAVLDLGLAEGLVARAALLAGARVVHGFEIDATRVEVARNLCHGSGHFTFRTADVSDWARLRADHADLVLERYDVVLYLGLHHHLPASRRGDVLTALLALARTWIAIRTPRAVFEAEGLEQLIVDRGFAIEEFSQPSHEGQGMLVIARRVDDRSH
ncbi:MAG: class I SAM-dependent methyltransferase [Hyphomicrobiaceae bacterium]